MVARVIILSMPPLRGWQARAHDFHGFIIFLWWVVSIIKLRGKVSHLSIIFWCVFPKIIFKDSFNIRFLALSGHYRMPRRFSRGRQPRTTVVNLGEIRETSRFLRGLIPGSRRGHVVRLPCHPYLLPPIAWMDCLDPLGKTRKADWHEAEVCSCREKRKSSRDDQSGNIKGHLEFLGSDFWVISPGVHLGSRHFYIKTNEASITYWLSLIIQDSSQISSLWNTFSDPSEVRLGSVPTSDNLLSVGTITVKGKDS